jgi:glycosyltransferase involved in cell wall biosynthesis
MSIYYKETASNLNQCLESLAGQTVPATEIIIVKDGNLTNELEQILTSWKNKLPLKIIGYEENRGLAYALNYGLGYCSYDLVARMDTDDIALPERFEKQVKFMTNNPEIAVSSAWVEEIDSFGK